MEHEKKLDKLKSWAETEDKKEKSYMFPIAIVSAIVIGAAAILYRSYSTPQITNNDGNSSSRTRRKRRRH